MKRILIPIICLTIVLSMIVYAEGPYGNHDYTQKGIMDGNQVVTEFYNNGQIADWPNQPACVWPKGTSHSYNDGVALIVSASTHDVNGNLIHPMSAYYREEIDTDPETGDVVGWAPLPGYANPNQDEPAMSDDPDSWPWTWPDKPSSWDGYWNGYFGKGIANADLETLFALDDAVNDEYEFYPDSSDSLRRGLGLNVEVRGFQWNHVLAEDCIFWHYEISNIGTTNYDSTVFGMYIDWGVGGTDDSGDDAGSYDLTLDLAYAWDGNGVGTPGGWGPVGVSGFAFLESPGNRDDNIDNDEDGLLDESRDNSEGTYEFGPIGTYGDSKFHWTGDEDGDWDAFSDLNGNDRWDVGEPLNDDLGEDGIGPNDAGYTGPDFGEGNGRPTQGEPDFGITDKDESDQIGLTAFVIFPVHFYGMRNEDQNWSLMTRIIEPTEEQLVGVNLAMYFFSGPFPLYSEGNVDGITDRERFSMALLFGIDKDDLFRNKKTVQAIYNANYNFAQPPLKPVVTAIPGNEKVTLYWDDVAELSYDRFLQEYDFEGYRVIRSTDPSFIDSKIITDAYGTATYRKPLVQYDLRDGLYGPHLVNVYGASFDLGSDSGLRHSYIDTDVKNGVTYYYAVVSYDYGYVDGTTYVDTFRTVENEDSLVVRFVPNLDDDGQIMGIAPTECTSIILGDVGAPAVLSSNTAMVVPSAPAAGFVAPQLENGIVHTSGTATGDVEISILLIDQLKNDNTYEVRFSEASTYGDFLHFTSKYEIWNLTEDEVVYESDTISFGSWDSFQERDPEFFIDDPVGRRGEYFTLDPDDDSTTVFWHPMETIIESPIIDGFSVGLTNALIDYKMSFTQDIDTVDYSFEPTMNYTGDFYNHSLLENTTIQAPYVYELRFYDEIVDTSIAALGAFRATPVKFELWNLTKEEESDFLYKASTEEEPNGNGGIDTVITECWIVPKLRFPSEPNRIICSPGIYLEAPANIIDTTIVGADTTIDTTFVDKYFPGDGEFLRWQPKIPFSSNDTYQFTINTGYLDRAKEKRDMNRIAVVPNPYVATAEWEPRVDFLKGRGPRKIDFIHLPRECTIRIYTVAGFLVDTIEHNSDLIDGSESWDLVSKDGMDIAYGIYVFHVDAPGVGEKIGKFAIIK